MTPESDPAPTTELDLTVEELWAVHAAVLEYIELATAGTVDHQWPAIEISVLKKLEEGTTTFTEFEIDRLQTICEEFAASETTPDRDYEPLDSVKRKIDAQTSVEL